LRHAAPSTSKGSNEVIYVLGEKRLQTSNEDYYIAPSAQVIGAVRLGRETSVWFNCVLRGDSDWLNIGDGSNVQDGTIIHTDEGVPVTVGRNVTLGHRAFLHGCTVDDDSLIANGAMVLDGASIGRSCIVASGALIPPNKRIPDGSVVMGSPGKIVRQVTDADLALIESSGKHYRARWRHYRDALTIDSRGIVVPSAR
jgi:carbonic anhydrase/acetyltransferase-like protein (isoleucine patch superfamily)